MARTKPKAELSYDERGLHFHPITRMWILIFMALAGLSPQATLADDRPKYFYRVRYRDSISEVLYYFGIKPIYGEKGTLQKMLVLNSKKNKTKGDKIFPGEILYLPLENKASLSPLAKLLPTGEIVDFEESETSVPHLVTTPILETQKIADDDRQSFFVIPQLNYTMISANDKINAGSLRATNGNYGFRLGYLQKWSDDLALFALINWYKIQLKSPLSTGATRSESSYSGFTIGTKHTLSRTLVLGTSLGIQEEPVISALSLTNLTIDRVGLIEVGANLSKVFAESSNHHFSLAGDIGGAFTLPTKTQNFDVSLGYVAYGKLMARSSLGPRTNLEIGPYYRFQSLNTTLIEQSLTTIGLTVQIQWWFGSRREAKPQESPIQWTRK